MAAQPHRMLSRAAVGYDTDPVGVKQGFRCETCASWERGTQTCGIVAGKLTAKDCCNFWQSDVGTVLAEKISQANAVVVEAPPTGNSHNCGLCHYFKKPRGCAIVVGMIDPRASCVLWITSP